MAYNKDSGESKLRKDVNQNTYVRRKNKSIFKNSQSAQSPPKQQRKTNYDWNIPSVDIPDNYEKETPKYEQGNQRYEREPQNIFEYEKEKKGESQDKQEMLSFMDVVLIIIANIVVPVAGGFVYYIALSAKGHKQKAAQSIVLSAIVSIIRIAYIRF
jgi:signal recognition particle GTPase